MRKLALVLVVIAGCSKINDRHRMCKAALDTLTSSLREQVTLQKEPAIKSKLEEMIAHAQDKFPAYCETASQDDIDCMSRGVEAMSDPKCKHAVDGVKTVFSL